MKKDAKKNILDLRGPALKKLSKGIRSRQGDKIPRFSKKVKEDHLANVQPIKEESPRKRMKSIWVVLISTFLTILLAGGGFVGYLYWQENFASAENKAELPDEEKIEGQNIVTITSNNEKIFITFYNPKSGKTITKETETGSTLSGGPFSSDNKNSIVQFSEDGQYFVALESAEPNFSNEDEFARIVKYTRDGKDKETLLESKNYLAYGNFLLDKNTIYYLASDSDANGDITSWSLKSFDVATKKEQILAEDVGEYFEKGISLRNNKIESLYKSGSYIYEASFDLSEKALSKQYLVRAINSRDFELEVEDVEVSPKGDKALYRNYSSWEGYSLKLFDKNTKRTSVLVKDKEKSFDEPKWISDSEILFKKSNVFSSLSEKSKTELIKLNIEDPAKQEIVHSSENEFEVTGITGEYLIFFEDGKMIYEEGKDKKEFSPISLSSASDILFMGVFLY